MRKSYPFSKSQKIGWLIAIATLLFLLYALFTRKIDSKWIKSGSKRIKQSMDKWKNKNSEKQNATSLPNAMDGKIDPMIEESVTRLYDDRSKYGLTYNASDEE
ncbi:hypothetical protein [Thermoflavimicrobium daqui]|uniref:Uncharacterized protein n=1 Tax=Thermoflavimicrobium daqui TaxID=2137476 RepID=A0A364K1W9_9BACL|nr:hypothetical protein [Thermoflavimicrobium daqui]RAL22021.1 hypothetical protein DL897_14510 [Thermoflavimicrobium daqui]